VEASSRQELHVKNCNQKNYKSTIVSSELQKSIVNILKVFSRGLINEIIFSLDGQDVEASSREDTTSSNI
jgi:hypothetical protein